jgi:hypothetical protein
MWIPDAAPMINGDDSGGKEISGFFVTLFTYSPTEIRDLGCVYFHTFNKGNTGL